MPDFLAITPEGFVDGLLTMDERAAAAHPLKPGYRLVRATADECAVASMMGRAVVHREGRLRVMPEPAALKWDAARRGRLSHLIEDRRRRQECRGASWWQEAVRRAGIEEIAEGDPAWAGPVASELPRPGCSVIPWVDVELIPGLWVRQIVTEADMADFEQHVLASRLFEEDEENTRARIARWLYAPTSLPLMMTWQGTPIQYECYHLDSSDLASDLGPGHVRAGFTTHLDDDRHFWFWAILAQPAFQAMYAAGLRTITASIVTNPPSYLAALQHYYNARVVGTSPDGRWAAAEYDLEWLVANPVTWPERRMAAAGWEWREGAVRVWQPSGAEVDALSAVLQDRWRFLAGGTRPQQILRDWTALDRATVMLGSLNDEIRYARIFRYRRDTTVSWASLLPFYDEPEQAVAARGFAEWARTVQYTKGTTFVPRVQYEHPVVQAHLAQQTFRLVRVREGGEELHELEFDF